MQRRPFAHIPFGDNKLVEHICPNFFGLVLHLHKTRPFGLGRKPYLQSILQWAYPLQTRKKICKIKP